MRGRLGVVLGSYLDAYLPDDAHELCEGNTFLAITRGELWSLELSACSLHLVHVLPGGSTERVVQA